MEMEKKGTKRTLDESIQEDAVDYSNMTEMDLELKEFKCPRCEKLFPTTNDLFAHMRKDYSDPTVCHVCDKNMKALATLLSHSYLHQGIKPYKCPKCDYSARTRFNIRVHFGACANVDKFKMRRGEPRAKKARKNLKKQNRTSKKQIDPVPRDNNTNNSKTGNFNARSDLLEQLVDAGAAPLDRDESALVTIHIEHFPPTTFSTTDTFYMQQTQPLPPQAAVHHHSDISQLYR
eukprot:184070_1